MKILNIDAFAKTDRQISLAGKTYPVEELSVQEFIDNMKAAEALEKEGADVSLSKSFEQAVAAVKQAIPTLPEAEIRKLKLPAMTAVLRFVRGELDPDVANAPTKSEAGAVEEKKPS